MTKIASIEVAAASIGPDLKRPMRPVCAAKWRTGSIANGSWTDCSTLSNGERRPKRKDSRNRDAHPRRELQLQAAAHDDLTCVGADHRRGLAGGEEADRPKVERVVSERRLERETLAL
eukprot:5656003-Prymnesium_polylepis.5